VNRAVLVHELQTRDSIGTLLLRTVPSPHADRRTPSLGLIGCYRRRGRLDRRCSCREEQRDIAADLPLAVSLALTREASAGGMRRTGKPDGLEVGTRPRFVKAGKQSPVSSAKSEPDLLTVHLTSTTRAHLPATVIQEPSSNSAVRQGFRAVDCESPGPREAPLCGAGAC
jgi:hypothetical protein